MALLFCVLIEGQMSTKTKEMISVIIPAYNYAKFLPQCIKTLLAQASDLFELEIIVVDDGSTDDTRDVVASYDVRYLYQENQGLSAARNTGIRAAQGDYVLFLDADDMLLEGCLEAHYINLQENPFADLSVGLCLVGSDRNFVIWPLFRDDYDVHFCRSNVAPVHTFLVRASVLAQVGFFRTATCC